MNIHSESDATDSEATQSRPTVPAPNASVPPSHQLATDDGELTVMFRWHGDRYAHSIGCSGLASIASREGTPEQAWPDSPAIQQLSTEIIEGKPTILGVGCCGTTHASVSVQTETHPTHGPCLRFDWAARLSKPLNAPDTRLQNQTESPDETRSPAETESPAKENGSSELAWLGSTYGQQSEHSLLEIVDLADDATPHTDRCQITPATITGVKTVQWSYRIQKSDLKPS